MSTGSEDTQAFKGMRWQINWHEKSLCLHRYQIMFSFRIHPQELKTFYHQNYKKIGKIYGTMRKRVAIPINFYRRSDKRYYVTMGTSTCSQLITVRSRTTCISLIKWTRQGVRVGIEATQFTI